MNFRGIYKQLVPSDFIKLQSIGIFDNKMVEVEEFHKMAICINIGVLELLYTKAFERPTSCVNSDNWLHIFHSHHLNCDVTWIGVKQT